MCEEIKNVIFLISGYSKSGKDYFSTHFQEYSYYSQTKNVNELNLLNKASTLKFSTSLIGLIDNIFQNNEPHESRKDKNPEGYEGTYRDYMKQIAYGIKLVDKSFFAKKIAKEIIDKKINIVKVTDFRFEEEYNYFQEKFKNTNYKIITIRVHRTGINIPVNIVSENSLDNFDFDFYVFSKDLERDSVKEMLKINKYFKKCKKINMDHKIWELIDDELSLKPDHNPDNLDFSNFNVII